MITKKQIAELLRLGESGGHLSPETKIQNQDVFVAIDIYRNYLISKSFNLKRAENDYNISGDFISSFENMPVFLNAERNLKYSDLPSAITLPQDRGIVQVSPMQNMSVAFIQLQPNSQFTYSGLESENLLGQTGFWIEGTKIFYRNIPFKYNRILVRMITSVSELDEDSPIPIPAEYEAELIQLLFSHFNIQQHIPQNKIADANSNT